MGQKHKEVAHKLPKFVIRCGPRRMLQFICDKCGTGVAFKAKNGRMITIPEGRWQGNDKKLMEVLGTERHKTVYENRATMLEAVKGAVTVAVKSGQKRKKFPTLVYQIDLEKLTNLIPENANENGSNSVAESGNEIIDSGAESALETEVISGAETTSTSNDSRKKPKDSARKSARDWSLRGSKSKNAPPASSSTDESHNKPEAWDSNGREGTPPSYKTGVRLSDSDSDKGLPPDDKITAL